MTRSVSASNLYLCWISYDLHCFATRGSNSVTTHFSAAQLHHHPALYFVFDFSLFLFRFPDLSCCLMDSSVTERSLVSDWSRLPFFANLRAASSVLVRWPISGASDRGSLTVAIKTYTCRRVHGRARAYTFSRALPPTVHLYLLLLHGVCLDLTPHLLRTIRKTHTPCANTHTHTPSFSPL